MKPTEIAHRSQGKPDISWAENNIPNLRKYAEQIKERDASTEASRKAHLKEGVKQ